MREVEAAATDLLAELVAIASVNPSLVPGAAGEAGIVEHLDARLTATGFSTTVVLAPGHPARPSLQADPPGPPEWPIVVLNGHLDTVGVAGMTDPFTPRVDGDSLHGRGAADMKGGVAAVVAAAEYLVAAGLRVRPVLALVADEEDASLGSEAVIAELPALGVRPDACLVAEPTDLALCRSLRGFAVVRVTFAGRAAHSSQAELGVKAVTHLGRLLHAVDGRAAAVRAGGGDLMVTTAAGGTSAFVVPDRAECIVELRTTPEQSSGDAVGLVRSLLEPEWQASAELVAQRDGWRLDDDGPAADLAARLGAVLGTGPTFDAPYWMEAPLWQQVCPTVVCGPAGGGLHSADEWVDLRQVRALATALVTVLSGWTPDAD
jgi:acetylornithine deacetylase